MHARMGIVEVFLHIKLKCPLPGLATKCLFATAKKHGDEVDIYISSLQEHSIPFNYRGEFLPSLLSPWR